MEMISEQYYHALKFINVMNVYEIFKKFMYFNILLFKSNEIMLNKSSNCVEYNDPIFIKMDSTLTKLYIFVINYLFFKNKLYFCKL